MDDMRNMLLSELIDKMHSRMSDKMFPKEEKPPVEEAILETPKEEKPEEGEPEEPSDEELEALLSETPEE